MPSTTTENDKGEEGFQKGVVGGGGSRDELSTTSNDALFARQTSYHGLPSIYN